MEDGEFVAGVASGLLLGLMVFALAGLSGCITVNQTSDFRHEAIKAGVGEYYLDANFERKFRWKTNTYKMEGSKW